MRRRPVSMSASSFSKSSLVLAGVGGILAGLSIHKLYEHYTKENHFKGREFLSEESRKKWKNRSIVSIENVSLQDMIELFHVTLDIKSYVEKHGCYDVAKGKILACIFYEPSTRTSSSFQTAMLRLGGQVLAINDMKSSSVAKGETLQDTMQCISQYSDIICLRHPMKGAAQLVYDEVLCEEKNDIPLLNAGDGSGEHPTQALLDLFTMFQFSPKHTIDGLCVAFVGDLKYGRTVHSLAPALCKFHGVTIYLISPESLRIPKEIESKMRAQNNSIHLKTKIDEEVIRQADVMYVTRVQKERFPNTEAYEKVKGLYVIDNHLLNRCKKSMILMHPLPRVNEITRDCDENPRAKYFLQMKYGMYVRMALLALILGLY